MNKLDYRFRGRLLLGTEWRYGSLVQSGGKCWIVQPNGENETRMAAVEPRSVGLGTGFHDRNGREIFENDILMLSSGKAAHVVLVPKGMEFMVVHGGTREIEPFTIMYDDYGPKNIKVVGNSMKRKGKERGA